MQRSQSHDPSNTPSVGSPLVGGPLRGADATKAFDPFLRSWRRGRRFRRGAALQTAFRGRGRSQRAQSRKSPQRTCRSLLAGDPTARCVGLFARQFIEPQSTQRPDKCPTPAVESPLVGGPLPIRQKYLTTEHTERTESGPIEAGDSVVARLPAPSVRQVTESTEAEENTEIGMKMWRCSREQRSDRPAGRPLRPTSPPVVAPSSLC